MYATLQQCDLQITLRVVHNTFHCCVSGLVYRGEYMVNWSPRLGTAVSDLEVDYSEEPGHLYFFRWGCNKCSINHLYERVL